MLLSDYIYLTRNLLRDANKRFWKLDSDITKYVNLARDRVAIDTNATRVNATIALTQGQEAYRFGLVLAAVQSLPGSPPARNIQAILNINFIQTTTFYMPLRRLAWSDFNRVFRSNPFQSMCQAWSMQGYGVFFLGPTPPGPDYTAEIDCLYLPNNLTDPANVETAIPDPLSELVPLMAARWATYYEQDKSRLDEFIIHYEMEKNMMLSQMPPFSALNRNI